MDREFFVKNLSNIKNSIVEGLIKIYDKPPGRKPNAVLKEISSFYHSIPTQSQNILRNALDDSVSSGIFHFLCILDHVSFIEDTEEKTTFELYAVKGGKRVLLNDEQDEPLHDMFNGLVLEKSE